MPEMTSSNASSTNPANAGGTNQAYGKYEFQQPANEKAGRDYRTMSTPLYSVPGSAVLGPDALLRRNSNSLGRNRCVVGHVPNFTSTYSESTCERRRPASCTMPGSPVS